MQKQTSTVNQKADIKGVLTVKQFGGDQLFFIKMLFMLTNNSLTYNFWRGSQGLKNAAPIFQVGLTLEALLPLLPNWMGIQVWVAMLGLTDF